MKAIRHRIVLTADELEAILAVAGAADAPAVFEDESDPARGDALLDAYERGSEKLRILLARKVANQGDQDE